MVNRKKKKLTIEAALLLTLQTKGKGIHRHTVVAVEAQPTQIFKSKFFEITKKILVQSVSTPIINITRESRIPYRTNYMNIVIIVNETRG